MDSSAVDGRVVIATGKLLDAGCVIYSEKVNLFYFVQINVPDEKIRDGINYEAYGVTFVQAFNEAYNRLPERQPTEVAA